MKSRVFVLGLLSLLWVGAVEASIAATGDGIDTELRELLVTHRLTTSSSLGEQVDLLKERPQHFKTLAKEKHVPFKQMIDEDGNPVLSSIGRIKLAPYSQEEMINCIKSISASAVAAHYEAGINALFANGKPPKHSIKKVTKGFQCLASKILFADALVKRAGLDENTGMALQMTAANQLLRFHKSIIRRHNPSLADAIPDDENLGCEYCLGIGGDESDAEFDDNQG